MYKLLIVDDEDYARECLENALDWSNLGFELAGSFSDGKYALEYLEKNKVELILADISMTFVSGLELAKEVQRLYPQTIVVLISGYSEFEYARKAIQYNVNDYLLKPTTYKELHATVLNIASKLKERDITASFLDDEVSLLRQQVLTELLTGGINSKKAFKTANIYMDPDKYCAASIELYIDNMTEYLVNVWKREKDRLYNALNRFIQKETAETHFVPVQYSFNSIKIVSVSKKNKADFKIYIDEYCKTLEEEIFSTFSLKVKIKVTQIADSLDKLARLKPSDALMAQQARVILSYIHASNTNAAISSVNSLLKTYEDNINMLVLLAEQLVLGMTDIMGLKELSLHNIHQSELESKQNIASISQFIRRIISVSIEYFSTDNLVAHGNLLEKAIKYMHEHVHDTTLEDVAAHVALNPAYFSRYFKNQTNEKFIDFLSRIKIEKAQLLLKDNKYKIHEVSKMVGYYKAEHFTRLFKFYTGFTPSEYRDNYKKGGQCVEKRN